MIWELLEMLFSPLVIIVLRLRGCLYLYLYLFIPLL
jgi:hypothetical protein